MTGIDQAYAEVQRVTRARAKNFAYGIMVLPREDTPRQVTWRETMSAP